MHFSFGTYNLSKDINLGPLFDSEHSSTLSSRVAYAFSNALNSSILGC